MILTTLLSVTQVLFMTFIILLLLLYIYFRKQYKYWERRKVPHGKPIFPFGSIKEALNKSPAEWFKKIYDKQKHQRYCGIWFIHKPVLMVNDPELIQEILIRNFLNFHSIGGYFDKEKDAISGSLFALQGEKWKNTRSKLTPMFTANKLQCMMPDLIKSSENLQKFLQERIRKNQIIDIKDFTLRYTLESLFSATFGIELHMLNSSSNSPIDELKYRALGASKMHSAILFLSLFAPEIAKMLHLSTVPKRAVDNINNILQEIINLREKNNYRRNNPGQTLIDLYDANSQKEEGNERETLFEFRDLTAHAMTISGSYEGANIILQFALYELAKNQEIQRKLKKEIEEVLARYNGQITYEGISEMEYLSCIIDETFRKYPVGPFLLRKCNTEFKDPGSELTIKKGDLIVIAVSGIHWDERYYPEPEKFEPERFIKENTASRPRSVYLPFGDGPRICIGKRLSYLIIRVGLISLMTNFDFDISEFTPNALKLEPLSVVLSPEGKLMLKISHSKK